MIINRLTGACKWKTTGIGSSTKRNNGLRMKLLRPLPVGCWDWTEAFALSRVPEPLRRIRRGGSMQDLSGGWGARASGLSHLTYETTGTLTFHQLDQPPFPCKQKLQAVRVVRQGWGLAVASSCRPGPGTLIVADVLKEKSDAAKILSTGESLLG